VLSLTEPVPGRSRDEGGCSSAETAACPTARAGPAAGGFLPAFLRFSRTDRNAARSSSTTCVGLAPHTEVRRGRTARRADAALLVGCLPIWRWLFLSNDFAIRGNTAGRGARLPALLAAVPGRAPHRGGPAAHLGDPGVWPFPRGGRARPLSRETINRSMPWPTAFWSPQRYRPPCGRSGPPG